MKKKLLILSACIGLILACFPFTLYAEEDPQSDLGVSAPLPPYYLDSYFYDNYYLLPYIEADGSQCIDLGVHASSELKIDFKVSDLDFGSNTAYIIGNLTAPRIAFYMYGSTSSGATQTTYAFYNNGSYKNYNLQPYNIYHFTFDKNVYYLNGNIINTFDYTQFESSQNMMLFGYNNQYYSKCKLYGLSIYDYDSAEYVKYFYPAKSKSGNVIGLYDSISKTFITTSGSDPFESPTDDQVIGFQISAFITAGLGWIGDILDFAIAEPLIICFMAIGLAGAMFRWGRRLVHF